MDLCLFNHSGRANREERAVEFESENIASMPHSNTLPTASIQGSSASKLSLNFDALFKLYITPDVVEMCSEKPAMVRSCVCPPSVCRGRSLAFIY